MRELVRTMADALEQRGLGRSRAIEIAQNGLTIAIEAINTEARRQGVEGECVGYIALEHVARAVATAEQRETWAAAEQALEAGDPGPLYTELHRRGEAAVERWGAR